MADTRDIGQAKDWALVMRTLEYYADPEIIACDCGGCADHRKPAIAALESLRFNPAATPPTPGATGFSNAGVECDMNKGPCSCGAWHGEHDRPPPTPAPDAERERRMSPRLRQGIMSEVDPPHGGAIYSPSAESVAQLFHETYERLAPSFGYKTREASAKPWADVPDQNKRLMIAVAGEVLSEIDRLSRTGDAAGSGSDDELRALRETLKQATYNLQHAIIFAFNQFVHATDQEALVCNECRRVIYGKRGEPCDLYTLDGCCGTLQPPAPAASANEGTVME